MKLDKNKNQCDYFKMMAVHLQENSLPLLPKKSLLKKRRRRRRGQRGEIFKYSIHVARKCIRVYKRTSVVWLGAIYSKPVRLMSHS